MSTFHNAQHVLNENSSQMFLETAYDFSYILLILMKCGNICGFAFFQLEMQLTLNFPVCRVRRGHLVIKKLHRTWTFEIQNMCLVAISVITLICYDCFAMHDLAVL